MTKKRKKLIDPIDVQLGNLLRLARKSSGLSQEQLGSMNGLTFQQIQKYERGDNRVSVSRLIHMAQNLGVSAAWFIEKLGNPLTSTEHGYEINLDLLNKREAQELLCSYANIKNKNERIFLRRITTLLASQGSGGNHAQP